MFSAAIDYFLTNRHATRKSLISGFAGWMVNSRTGKTDVNPLTRPSSRSVMRGNYFVAAC